MSDKTQRIMAGPIGVALFVGGAVLFVLSLLDSEPSVAGLVIGGALVTVAMLVASWVVAERAPRPEPIDLTRNRDHRPGDLPDREAASRRSANSTPMSRFVLAVLAAGGGGAVIGAGLESSADNDWGPILIIVGAVLLAASQYQLIAAGVSRGILDTRE